MSEYGVKIPSSLAFWNILNHCRRHVIRSGAILRFVKDLTGASDVRFRFHDDNFNVFLVIVGREHVNGTSKKSINFF